MDNQVFNRANLIFEGQEIVDAFSPGHRKDAECNRDLLLGYRLDQFAVRPELQSVEWVRVKGEKRDPEP